MECLTKEEIIEKIQELADKGWVENQRAGNQGGAGNTLEDFLGIKENNLPIANAAEWELKSFRTDKGSLVTLSHMEPSPRALGIVPKILLPKYGWKDKNAGIIHPETEMGFRQTIYGNRRNERGFQVIHNKEEEKLEISFDASTIDKKHAEWKNSVEKRVGLEELNPKPYWGCYDLEHKFGDKLHNCFFVIVDVKKDKRTGKQFFWYKKALLCKRFQFENYLKCLADGIAYIDFDARTGHNHGTKFRVHHDHFPSLYEEWKVVVDNTEKKPTLDSFL